MVSVVQKFQDVDKWRIERHVEFLVNQEIGIYLTNETDGEDSDVERKCDEYKSELDEFHKFYVWDERPITSLVYDIQCPNRVHIELDTHDFNQDNQDDLQQVEDKFLSNLSDYLFHIQLIGLRSLQYLVKVENLRRR